jgi:HSP20 family protein
MNYPTLRRDLDALFAFPFIRFTDPYANFEELRREAMDLFDTHLSDAYALEAPQAETASGEKPAEGADTASSSSSSSSSSSTAVQRKPVAVQQRTGPTMLARRVPFAGWCPKCDVEETETEFVIHAEVPGYSKEQINIDIDETHNILSISAATQAEREEKKETEHGRFHYMERSRGNFQRSFRLPKQCQSKLGEIAAKSADGVLEIICPKEPLPPKPEPKVRKIAIQ